MNNRFIAPLLLFFAVIFGNVQAQQTQILDFVSPQVLNRGRELVYENDTLRIQYDFWHERGLLSFSVYNKLGRPLYIDWAQSGFKLTKKYKMGKEGEPHSIPYWHDNRKTPDSVFYKPHFYKGPAEAFVKPVGDEKKQYTLHENTNEKITLLVPEHGLLRSTVLMFPGDTIRMDTAKPVLPPGVSADTMKRKPMPPRNLNYTAANSPVEFVNTLVFSDRSDTDPAYTFKVNHKFYLKSVRSVPARMFARYSSGGIGMRPGMPRPGMPGMPSDSAKLAAAKGLPPVRPGMPADTGKAALAANGMPRPGMPGGREGFNPMRRPGCIYLNGTFKEGTFDRPVPVRPAPGSKPNAAGVPSGQSPANQESKDK